MKKFDALEMGSMGWEAGLMLQVGWVEKFVASFFGIGRMSIGLEDCCLKFGKMEFMVCEECCCMCLGLGIGESMSEGNCTGLVLDMVMLLGFVWKVVRESAGAKVLSSVKGLRPDLRKEPSLFLIKDFLNVIVAENGDSTMFQFRFEFLM